MSDPIGNSQETNEDPTGPGSRAVNAFLTITPLNAMAKYAFSNVADWVYSQHNNAGQPQGQDSTASNRRSRALKYMWLSSTQTKDEDVTRYIRRRDTGHLSSSSSSPTSSYDDKKYKKSNREDHTLIWTGCYFLDLSVPPVSRSRGWLAGRLAGNRWLNNGRAESELILTTDNSSTFGIKQRHAVFQFHRATGRVSIQGARSNSPIEVDGKIVPRGTIHVLNDESTTLRLDELSYEIRYGRYTRTEVYLQFRNNYLALIYPGPQSSIIDLTPTPSGASVSKLRQWSITEAGTIGTGAMGRVSVAVHNDGRVAAVKRIAGNLKTSSKLQRCVQTLNTLTDLAVAEGETRVLRLIEMLTDDPNGKNATSDIWFLLQPAAGRTLWDCRYDTLKDEPNG